MCINPQVEAIAANETIDGRENFVFKNFDKTAISRKL